MKRIHVSRPCSRRLAISCRTVKMASEQPRLRRKPHCASWSSDSMTGSSRSFSRFATILYATSSIMMPLYLPG